MTLFLLLLLASVQCFIIVLGFASALRSSLFQGHPDALYILINTNVALLGLLLGTKIAAEMQPLKKALGQVRGAIDEFRKSRSEVTALAEERFYSRLEEALKHATIGVSLAHLDTRPPSKPKNSAGDAYYTNLPKLIKKSKARFRRVERASADKLDWLEMHVRQYENQENYSLGVLIWPEKERKTSAISVQLIDTDTSVLVAVAHHEGIQGPRDLWIRDADATRLWQEYYEQALWGPAVKLIENGKVNWEIWEDLKSRYPRVANSATSL